MNAENSKWDIIAFADDFEICGRIGEGNFGYVYKAYAKRKDPPELVAYKVAKWSDPYELRMIIQELILLV